jgi:hypothetical protein
LAFWLVQGGFDVIEPFLPGWLKWPAMILTGYVIFGMLGALIVREWRRAFPRSDHSRWFR